MIAHRLTTVIDTDCIYVLQGGRIVESGRHSELAFQGWILQRCFTETNYYNAREGDEVLKPPK